MGMYVPIGGGGSGGGGGGGFTVQNVSANTTLANTGNLLVLASSASASITVTLAPAASCAGATVVIRRISTDSNQITISGQMDGITSSQLRFWQESEMLISDGTIYRHVAHDSGGWNSAGQANGNAGPGWMLGPGICQASYSNYQGGFGAGYDNFTGAPSGNFQLLLNAASSNQQWISQLNLSGGGMSFTTGAPQNTLNGTTAGQALYYEIFRGPNYKKFLIWLNGYQNNTATAQTISYNIGFGHTPYLAHDDSGGATTTTGILTLPTSMGAAKTGWIVIEGW